MTNCAISLSVAAQATLNHPGRYAVAEGAVIAPARYAGARGSGSEFVFETRFIDGEFRRRDLPPRAERLVREWAYRHRTELEENWRRCEQRVPLDPLEPLR